jgi:hypothetical protein
MTTQPGDQQTGQQQTQPPAGDGQQQGQQQQTGGQAPPQDEPRTIDTLPSWAQDEIRQARQEAGRYRTELRSTQEQAGQRDALLQQVAKALGLQTDGTPDPAKLTDEVKAAQATANQRAVELAVYRSAGKVGANGDTLLDSRTFMASVADLDPSAGDFNAKVEQAIKDAVSANPRLKAEDGTKTPAPPAPKSGGDHGGGGKAQNEPQPGQDRMRAAYAESAQTK